jgi:hypothetical protein
MPACHRGNLTDSHVCKIRLSNWLRLHTSFSVMESHNNDIELHTMDLGDDENSPFPGTLWYHEKIRLALAGWVTQFFPIVLMIPINNVQAWHQPMTSWWHNVENHLFIQQFIADLVNVAKHEQYRFVHRRQTSSSSSSTSRSTSRRRTNDSVAVECHEDAKIKYITAMFIQQILQNDLQRARNNSNNDSTYDDNRSDDDDEDNYGNDSGMP